MIAATALLAIFLSPLPVVDGDCRDDNPDNAGAVSLHGAPPELVVRLRAAAARGVVFVRRTSGCAFELVPECLGPDGYSQGAGIAFHTSAWDADSAHRVPVFDPAGMSALAARGDLVELSHRPSISYVAPRPPFVRGPGGCTAVTHWVWRLGLGGTALRATPREARDGPGATPMIDVAPFTPCSEPGALPGSCDPLVTVALLPFRAATRLEGLPAEGRATTPVPNAESFWRRPTALDRHVGRGRLPGPTVASNEVLPLALAPLRRLERAVRLERSGRAEAAEVQAAWAEAVVSRPEDAAALPPAADPGAGDAVLVAAHRADLALVEEIDQMAVFQPPAILPGEAASAWRQTLLLRHAAGLEVLAARGRAEGAREAEFVRLPGGCVDVGQPPTRLCAGSFELARREVTHREYARCVAAGACVATPCAAHSPDAAIGCLTRGDAEAYARFAGARLPTLPEWSLAATRNGTARYPWGDAPATIARAVIADIGHRPVPTPSAPIAPCSRPLGNTPEGICDLVGNVAEWVVHPDPVRAYRLGREAGLLLGEASMPGALRPYAELRHPKPRVPGRAGVRLAR